jgi:hypothetical protein
LRRASRRPTPPVTADEGSERSSSMSLRLVLVIMKLSRELFANSRLARPTV